MTGVWPIARPYGPGVLWLAMLACSGTHAQAPAAPENTPAAIAVDSLRLAAGVGRALEVPEALIVALVGLRAELATATIAAHLLQSLQAVEPARLAWQRVAALAERVGNVTARMHALEMQAEMTLLLSDYRGATRLAEMLLTLARQMDSHDYEAAAFGYYGVIARRRGDLDAAHRHYTASITILRDGGNPFRLALMLGNFGTVMRDRGDFAGALELQLEALAIRERIGDRLETSLRNIALLYREIEDEKSARNYFERAFNAVDKRASPERYASIRGSYASLLNDLGEHAHALAAANEALTIDSHLGNRSNQGLERLEAGRALHGLGNVEEAVSQLESALDIGRQLGQREIVSRALLSLAEIEQARHNSLRARGMIDEAIAGLEAARLLPQLVQAYAVREKIALAQHDPDTALRFLRRHAEQRELLLGTRASRQLGDLQARHARAEADKDLALLQKDNELQTARLDKQEVERQVSLLGLAALLLALLLISWRFLGVYKLNAALRSKNLEIDAKSTALANANLALEQRARQLYRAAISDPLTGVHNRSHLRELIAASLQRALDAQTDLAVLVIDFDHFKLVNDQLGHLAGDRVLLSGVAAMRECLEAGDIFGRFGGEEFVIVMHGERALAASEIAEFLRAHLQQSLTRIDTGGIEVTVSIGVAGLSDLAAQPAPSVDALLDAGDRAMYEAKEAGRNRVARHDQVTPAQTEHDHG